MGRPKSLRHPGIITRPGILVPDQDRDRSAKRSILENAGQDFAAILLLSLGCELALSRPTPVQLSLNRSRLYLYVGRTTINDDPNAAPMRFAEGGDAEKVAKGVAH
jgi:hypothetical protein